MSDPALAVQGAVVFALKGVPSILSLVGQRIYDRVPGEGANPTPSFPYISLGEGQTVPVRDDCVDGSEHFFTVHVWSREPGFPECKRIASAIRDTLHDADLAVPGFTLIDLALEGAQYLRDPDGLTSHCALSFRALLDPAD